MTTTNTDTKKRAHRTALGMATPVAVAAAALAAIAVLASCAGKSSNVITITAAKAAEGTVTRDIEFSGVLAPDQTVNVFSELGGHATEVTASVGDKVKAGDLLVQIDTRELQAQLAEAKAAEQSVEDQAGQAQLGIDTAKANLDLVQKSYDRTAALYKTQAVSKTQMDDAQNKLDTAQAAYKQAEQQYQLLVGSSLAAAKARVELIQVQISNSVITSPLSGVVTNRNVNPGEIVGMAQPVMTIANTALLKLQGTVSQDVVPLLTLGRKIQVSVDGMPSVSYQGTISQVGPVAASTGQYFPVVVNITNDGRLLAGMTAMASFQVSGPQSVVVPSASVQRDGRDFYVYVISGGKVSRVKVTVGLQSTTQTSVSGGLHTGDSVATSNIGLLQDGMPVTVIQ